MFFPNNDTKFSHFITFFSCFEQQSKSFFIFFELWNAIHSCFAFMIVLKIFIETFRLVRLESFSLVHFTQYKIIWFKICVSFVTYGHLTSK